MNAGRKPGVQAAMPRRALSVVGLGVIVAGGACGGTHDAPPDAPPDVPPDAPPGVLAAPTEVRAADGERADYVEVSWRGVEGATSYRVLRNGAQIGVVAASPYADITAASAGPPVAPQAFAATQGTSAVEVELSWWPPSAPWGQAALYMVVAVGPFGESPPSASDIGHLAAPITHFEVSTDGGVSFRDVGLTRTYDDLDAPYGMLVAGPATASDGASDTVDLAVSVAGIPGAARSYLVRAVNADGAGPTAGPVTGFRGYGSMSYHWERSATDADAGYTGLLDTEDAIAVDQDAPANADGRYYRCVVSAAGAVAVTAGPDRGWRTPSAAAVHVRDTWVIDGEVHAIATGGDTIYLAGKFGYIGPPNGAFVKAELATGSVAAAGPRVSQLVEAMAPDGAGGWYLAGVGPVDGIYRQRLAHVTGSGTLDPVWAPVVDHAVKAIVKIGDRVYLGGEFTTIAGVPRPYLAAVDATTGQLAAWNPGANGPVLVLAEHAGALYAGGTFTQLGGVPRRLARIDATTGAVDAWNPGLTVDIKAIVPTASAVYASAWLFVAVVDPVTGEVTAGINTDGDARAMQLVGDTLYLGGNFRQVGGVDRSAAAAVDVTTGQVLDWNPSPDGTVTALAVAGSSVYLGGTFRQLGGQARRGLGAVDATTGLPTAFVCHAATSVAALAVEGSSLVVGGQTSVGGELRSSLAAIDATTGVATAWAPEARYNGQPADLRAILVLDQRVYFGGDLTTVDAASRVNLAAVDTAGALLAWDPHPDRTVMALAADGGQLYVAGQFVSIGGVARHRLAELDPVTGQPTAWNGGASGAVNAIAVSASTVYASGQFRWMKGQPRLGLGAVDRATGAVLPWDPQADGLPPNVTALALGPGVVYAGGLFTTIGGVPRRSIAAIDPITGQPTAWHPVIPDAPGVRVNALAVAGTDVYAGGLFGAVGPTTVSGIATIDAGTGIANGWYPRVDLGWISAIAFGAGVRVIGGLFHSVEGLPRSGFAVFEP